MNRALALLALGSSAIALTACGPHVHFGRTADISTHGSMKVISKLTCPEDQGDLSLISAAPDGTSCSYKDEDDETEVTLRLVALNGDTPRSALTPIESELKALMPQSKAQSATEAAADTSERQTIDLPGVHIRAGDHGARVRVAGIDIDANDDSSEIRIDHNTMGDADTDGDKGAVTIKAGDDTGVDVSTDNDEEAHRHHRRHDRGNDVTALYMLASDKATSGFHLVGYDAAGPKAGPLAVAIVKSKSSDDDEHRAFSDAKALVRLNVGGGHAHITID